MKSAAASTLGTTISTLPSSLQQWRGIRVRVRDGNLEQALAFMQRKMQSSGIERLIKQQQTCHIKDSEKRVLARKSLQRRIQSDDLARKLKTILLQKVRSQKYVPKSGVRRNGISRNPSTHVTSIGGCIPSL
ncbi:hypothetical protein AKJ16_DCAP19994, partial [Drosera capensis]